MPQQPPQASQQQSLSYKIDPDVLHRPVRIRIDGSSRMLTKDILSQVVQFMFPFLSNGPFLQQLLQSGYTVDWPTLFKMVQDATGTQKQYPLMRPLNQQEEQRLQQPPPQVRAQMQAKQQEGQTRKDIMQMKLQADQAKTESAERVKTLQISEESARHILEQILNDGGPEAKMLEARLKAQEGQQKLQHQSQMHQMDLQAKQREHAMSMQQQQHQMGMDLMKARMEHQMGQAQHATKMQQLLSQARVQSEAQRLGSQQTQQVGGRPRPTDNRIER